MREFKTNRSGVSTVEYIILLLGVTVSMPILASIVMPYLEDRNCEAAELLDDPACFSARIGVPDKEAITYKGIPVAIDLLEDASVVLERLAEAPRNHPGLAVDTAFAQTSPPINYIDARAGEGSGGGDGETQEGDASSLRVGEIGPPRIVEIVSARTLSLGDGRLVRDGELPVVTYDPLAHFEPLRSDEHALVAFEFAASGADGTSASATANVTVLGFHADPDYVTVSSDDAVLIDVLANDHLPGRRDEVSIVSVTQPPSNSGRVDIVEDRIVFSPRNDFWSLAEGAERVVHFSYTIEGPMSVRASAEVAVTVVGAPLPQFVKIDTGVHRYCALSTRGQVYCWGSNANNRPLGIWHVNSAGNQPSSSSTNRPRRVLGPNGIGFLAGVTDIAVGDDHSCALVGNGEGSEVWCWGSNLFGQIGKGNHGSSSHAPYPERVIGVGGNGFLTDIRALASGPSRPCAITTSDTAACWGIWASSSASWSGTPRMLRGLMNAPLLTNIHHLEPSDDHNCAIVTNPVEWRDAARGIHDRIAVCWGNAVNHVLGNGHARPSGWGNSSWPVPVMADGFHHALGAPFRHDNSSAPYPNGLSIQDGLPEPIIGPVSHLSVGRNFNCLVKTESSGDAVYCWGEGLDGNLGIGTYPDEDSYLHHPNCPIGAIHNYSNVPRPGLFHSPIATPGPCEPEDPASCHSVNCNRNTAKRVINLPTDKRVASLAASNVAGAAAACAAYEDGEIWCWGNNRWGQLATPIGIETQSWPGTGRFNQRYYHEPIRPVMPAGGFRMLSMRGWAACGLNPANDPESVGRAPLSCWGRNSPAMPGAGSLGISPSPTVVPLR